MVHLLEQHLSEHGFRLMLLRTPGEVRDLVNATDNLAVDGAIAIDMLNLVREIHAAPNIPCVSISTSQQVIVDNVFVDLSASVERAIALMIQAGRRRIAYLVSADIMAAQTETRAGAYMGAMRAAGRPIEIFNAATDELDCLENNFRIYVERNGCPDGLLCQNDETAMCALQVLRELGYTVPDDVLLVGCDGQHHMRYFSPPLSTISQPMNEICAPAWEFLQNRIADPGLPHQQATVQGELIVRESLLG